MRHYDTLEALLAQSVEDVIRSRAAARSCRECRTPAGSMGEGNPLVSRVCAVGGRR